MKKSLISTYVFLLIITIATACVSGMSSVFEVVVALIMVLAGLKVLLVAFHFMELKKAHSFWKITLILTVGLFIVLVVSLKLTS